MSETTVRIHLHEGSGALPPGFADRSANLFVPGDPQRQPNLSIARDWLERGEALAVYVERQLGMLKARLPGHKLLARDEERLGPGPRAHAGMRIDAQYRSGAQQVRQRQAAFDIGDGRVLVFSAATPGAFDEAFEALWRAWLDSFQLQVR